MMTHNIIPGKIPKRPPRRFAPPAPPAPPAPDRPTRDTSRKPYIGKPNRLWQAILLFIDWLNRLTGAEKPKRKTNGEQMDSISDLFEEVEPGVDWGADEDKPKSAGSYKSAGGYIYRRWDDNDRSEDYEDVGRERGTDHVMGG